MKKKFIYDTEPICNTCMGEGKIVTCCDDLCVGAGECMHGDGESICPECHGKGSDLDE